LVYTIFRLIVIAIFVVAGIVGWRLLQDPAEFPVRHINVSSNYQHITPVSLERLITPYALQGFWSTHLNDLQQQLAQLPWVANAEVERVWPDTFSIRIVEYHPIARWNQEKLLSDQMQVFSVPQSSIPNNLPQINAPDDQAQLMSQYFAQMQEMLKPLQLEVTKFEVNSRQAFHAVLNSDIDVYFGRGDPTAQLHKFITVYNKIIGPHIDRVISVDLRYNNGLTIAWKTQNDKDDATK
jgi:cell division protein FtsQ